MHKTVSVIVETLLQVKEKTLRQAKGSENTVCFRVGPDGAANHDRFRDRPTGPSYEVSELLEEVGGRPFFACVV